MRIYPAPRGSEADVEAHAVLAAEGSRRRATAVLARRLGHTEVGVVETVSGRKAFTWCACGYVSLTRSTYEEAVEAAIWHLDKAVDDWCRTGQKFPPEPGPRPIPWEAMAKRYSHVAAWLNSTRSADRAVS